jgi:hypothetical protein
MMAEQMSLVTFFVAEDLNQPPIEPVSHMDGV